MAWRVRRKPLKVFTRGVSLRRRVAYSLAIVRLILVPVILLAVYYLFAMRGIVDRIESQDAPTARDAERASIEILNARRAERNYFLLHDPQDLAANRESLTKLQQIISACRRREPEEAQTLDRMDQQLKLYRDGMKAAAARIGTSRQAPVDRIREVVRAYEKDLDNLLKRAHRQSRAHLVEELRNQVDSFDAQMAETAAAEDPAVRDISQNLRAASDEILSLASELGARSWDRVEKDHQEARALVDRAEWVFILVGLLTLIVSVWVSFVLPREAVRPLSDLKAAVDHAAAGNYEIEFDVQGEGEVVQLAHSIRHLIAHIREKLETEVTGPRR
jgi:CHASE3 domain sensor protein